MFFSRKKKAQAQAAEGRYPDYLERQAAKELRREQMEAQRVGHKPLDNPTYSDAERREMAALEREDLAKYFKRAQGLYADYRMRVCQRMGSGEVRELEAVAEVSPALIGAVQDKLGAFIEGRACTASGDVVDTYDSFMPLQLTHEENGAKETIPTCQLAVYLDGGQVSQTPYEFKAPKVTVVYKDDLSNIPHKK